MTAVKRAEVNARSCSAGPRLRVPQFAGGIVVPGHRSGCLVPAARRTSVRQAGPADRGCRSDVESCAECGDHVQQPELAEAVPEWQGHKYPADWIAWFCTRLGYSRRRCTVGTYRPASHCQAAPLLTAYRASTFRKWIKPRLSLLVSPPPSRPGQIGSTLVIPARCRPIRQVTERPARG